MTGLAGRARVLALSLDAVDPRFTSDERADAAQQAVDLDAEIAYAVTRGMVYGLLRFVRDRHGAETMAVVMTQLASRSMVVLEDRHG